MHSLCHDSRDAGWLLVKASLLPHDCWPATSLHTARPVLTTLHPFWLQRFIIRTSYVLFITLCAILMVSRDANGTSLLEP